jgi:hypothetical protein
LKVNKFLIFFGISLFFVATAFGVHKFYVSIYQVSLNTQKQRLEIATRIFTDDLNDVLSKKYKTKTHIGEAGQTEADLKLFEQYFLEKCKITIDKQPKKIVLVNTDLETNVFIAYFVIQKVNRFKTIQIENNCLLDFNNEQQNIIQTNINNNKKVFLLDQQTTQCIIK